MYPKMSSIKNSHIEESFAPNAHENIDDSSQTSMEGSEYPVKRYATRLANAEAISKNLKAENLKQVKNQIKKEESEQLRYLSLDNASKEVEILELKEKLVKLEKIVKAFENFEELMKKFERNAKVYEGLIGELNNKDYKELMNHEIQKIEIIPNPTLDIPELTCTVNALSHSFIYKKKIEEINRERFHEAIFTKASVSKRILFRSIEFVVGILIFIILYKKVLTN